MNAKSKIPSATLAPFALVLGLLTGAELTAQEWKLPRRGVAVYKRTVKLDGKPPALARHKVPALLLQSELDPKQKFMKRPPSDLQELAMWLAFDLRRWKKKGRFKAMIPFIHPYGSIWVEGTTSSLDDLAAQTIKGTVFRREAIRDETELKSVHAAYKSKVTTDIRAEFELKRRFDADKGVVTWIKSDFFGHTVAVIGEGKKGTEETFAYHEEWEFEKALDNRYAGFNVAVKNAIVKGSDRIRARIANPDGGQIKDTPDAERSTNTGRLALALLTLLKADILPTDEIVKRGFDSLRRREIRGAYECSVAIMAMEALYANPNERQLLLEGRIAKPIPRKPSAEDLALMEEWTKRILSYTDTRIKNKAYLMRFNYLDGAGRYDNSVTQYCVLGLYSAHLCGVKISPTVWYAISKHVLMDQVESEGKKIAFSLTPQTQFQKQVQQRKDAARSGKSTRTVSRARQTRVLPMGWPYVGRHPRTLILTRPLTGSMTTAGLTNLTICEAVLRHSRKAGNEALSEMKKRVRHGFAWLLENFTVRDNPNHHAHHLYYLYGLERAAELAQVGLIGDRDWYFEGAMLLIRMQTENGAFTGGLVDDCFAVLFLKQAAPPLPSYTGR